MTLGVSSSLLGVTDHIAGSVFGAVNGTYSAAAPAYIGNMSNSVSLRRRLGADVADTPGSFFNGAISEVLLYEFALSNANLDKLIGYLHWRWQMVSSLANGHPYKNTPPTP
jgi:hypothetical protein